MAIRMTTDEIASTLGGTLRGQAGYEIHGLAKIEDAGPHELTFIANMRYARHLETTQAGAVLVAPGFPDARTNLIEVADPYRAFLRLLETFHPKRKWVEPGIHETAVIASSARLANDVSVGAFAYVGPGVEIGEATTIYPHVVVGADARVGKHCEIHSHASIREGVVLGDYVVIQDGAVIGSDGFGFAPTDTGYEKIPQMGIVVIHEGAEVGANTTVDRATLGRTEIGKGTKLDNLIQVAHNVTIGSHTVIAAQTGISGSARIGDQCRIGGQVGVVGHLRVGDRVNIGAQSGVAGAVEDGSTVSGSPARPHSLWKRIEAAVTRLPELYRRVRRLEATVFPAEKKDDQST